MFGVCYYPEHWPRSQWHEDAKMMAELGLIYVRIGEFAWSRLEPNPGEYNFGWLDAAEARWRLGSLGGDRAASGVAPARQLLPHPA